MMKLRGKTFPLKLCEKKNGNLVGHVCQNIVTMETSKLMDKGN